MEYTVDPHLSLVETNMNVLATEETKPQTKPHPICHDYKSPDPLNDMLTYLTV